MKPPPKWVPPWDVDDDSDTEPAGPSGSFVEASIASRQAMDAAAAGAGLQSDNWTERWRALASLAEASSTDLARHADAVVARLERDEDPGLRQTALEALAQLECKALAEHADAIVKRLDDLDPAVRRAAGDVLQRMPPEALAWRAGALARRCTSADVDTRLAALKALGRLHPEILAEYAGAILRSFEDSDEEVRQVASCALRRFNAPTLENLAEELAQYIQDADPVVGQAVVDALGKLEPEVHEAVLGAETLLHHAARLGCVHVIQDLSSRYRTLFLHARDALGNTPLHLAARENQVGACTVLMRAGALRKAMNCDGKTPIDLAEKALHSEIASLLRQRQVQVPTTFAVADVRGGLGDALSQAMADERPVVGVEWYTLPLPGTIGSVGGIHSLLAVTVGKLGERSHTYVIEKAATPHSDHSKADAEQVRHGVHVSHWLDVVPRVDGDPIYALRTRDIAGYLCMRTLRDTAVDLGSYSVGECNCHHGALAVYNSCALERAHVSRPPNEFLTLGARLLGMIGIDVGGSRSIRSVSRSAQGSAEAAAGANLQARRGAAAGARPPET